MANIKKISELPELTNANYDDVVPIVNGGQTKKIKLNNISNYIVIENLDSISTIVNAKKGMMIYCEDSGENQNTIFIVTSVVENENGESLVNEYKDISEFVKSSIPKLSYDESLPAGSKLYKTIKDDIILSFKFSSDTYGNANYKIYRDGVLIKSFTDAKGNMVINLGRLTNDGSYVFSVTATDYLGIPAPETLTYEVVCGGLKLTSTFDKTIEGTIYELDTEISIPYSVSCSDISANIKIYCSIMKNDSVIKSGTINIIGSSSNGMWNAGNVLETGRGQYTVSIQGYTGESLQDQSVGTFISDKLIYNFNVLAKGEIAIVSSMNSVNLNTDSYISIPFKVVTKVANYLLVRGSVLKYVNDEWVPFKDTGSEGIQCTMNVTNFFSVGMVDAGRYKYELIASTLDNGIVSIDNAIGEFNVATVEYQKVQPVTTNLIAWFDANSKRNSDLDKNIWYNNVTLGDTFRVRLYDLNYETNGWVPVDENLSDADQGERMLKFTGNSYGELVKMNNGVAERYSPFSVFSNSGLAGFAFEILFRTRCVGDMKTKVFTCQEGDSSNTCGISAGYHSMFMSSDAQTTELMFAEDEWIHAVYVVDRDIRISEDLEEDSIENLNPINTMRMYINGSLCRTIALKNDKFLDAGGNSFPLILNACLKNNEFINFGESEIKMVRMYNSYLTSSDVLNNYISSFYDLTEQKEMQLKNDIKRAALPTITLRRKTASTNKNTFSIMNSIKDKATSKKYCVDCVMKYDDGNGNITTYDNIDVFLQGTSSLQYPVKNYLIKAYSNVSHTDKFNFVPSNKETEWLIPDYTYTFKCDYMEGSHMNNTPTAVFYDQVIEGLKGESPARKDGYRDSIDGFPIIVYYCDSEDEEPTLAGSYMFNIDKKGKMLGFDCDIKDANGDIIGNGENSCISYEGAANASDTSGCFFKLEESIGNVYSYYVQTWYEEYKTANSGSNTTLEEFVGMINRNEVDYDTFEEFKQNYDEIDYVMDDWEARYSAYDTDIATYTPMLNLINWVSDSTKNGTFKKDFSKHFDLTYCLAYFLQMMVFAQVDNCGKNMMMDTWDGQIFYPRPYDMDTEMGLSNTGTDTIGSDAEILPLLSPTSASGVFASSSNNDTITQNRYLSYNTKTSKLWNNFAISFKDEIKKAYQNLRGSGIYSYENILKTIHSMTIDKIGQVYYNKDMATKYLSQISSGSTEYLKTLHGNRVERYKQFLKERLLFCDTIFNYEESEVQTDTLNSSITLRSDAFFGNEGNGENANTLKCSLGISVYSPQYVTVNVGSGLDAIITAYVSPDSTYIDPDTQKQEEGTLFTFPMKATDKEMIITGAGNIKAINRLDELNVRDLTIAKAEKILKLNLSSSTRMTALALGNNKYLRELDCSFSYLLGTGVGGQSLNLTNCRNLKTLDIRYTKLTSLILPQNGNLESIKIDSSSIKSLSIDGMAFLKEVTISNCTEISNYSINACPRITSIDVSGSSVKSFSATNCSALTSVNVSACKTMVSFDVTNSDNISSLDMNSNVGTVMNDLKLYTLYNLTSLNVSKTTSLTNIRFPKYLTKEDSDKANAGDITARLWNKLESFILSDSSIKYIQYGSNDVADGSKSCNMEQLNNLRSLSFSNCTSVISITNLNYTNSSMASLFYNCTNLTTITGTLTCNSSISSIFSICTSLNNITNLVLNFTGVSNADSALYRCYSVNTSIAKRILDACGTSLRTINSFVNMWGSSSAVIGSSSDSGGRTIPSNLFENTPNITSMTSCFYRTRYTTVPNDLLSGLNSINNLQSTFATMKELVTVGPDLLKNKSTLTNVKTCFAHNDVMANYMNVNPNIFEGSSNITNTTEMFARNYKLLNTAGFGEMLEPLTKLTNAEYMFYGCYALRGAIPNGLFSNNVLLRKIDGIFALCTGLSGIPTMLFRKLVGDSNTLPYLTEARSLFSGCTSLSGIVSPNFFLGASNITTVGEGSNTSEYDSGNYYGGMYGLFANTIITGYHETFLAPLTKLTDCSGLFRKTGTENTNSFNTCLKYCYYYDASVEKEYTNSIGPNLFKYNTLLQNVNFIFERNQSLIGCIPKDLFKTCKLSLKYTKECFLGCISLNGNNLDNTNELESSLVGISADWFSGAVNLLACNDFMNGCRSYNGSVPADLFKDCVNLQYVQYFFNGCEAIDGEIPIGLFNYCRGSLKNTSYMFTGCYNITGVFPTGSYSTDTGVSGYEICLSTDEGALNVVRIVTDPLTQIAYTTVIDLSSNLAVLITDSGSYYVKPTIGDVTTVIQPGLLSECLNLENTSYMFYDCRKLGTGSSLPSDIFYTSGLTKKYNYLVNTSYMFAKTAFNVAYRDSETDLLYLCDSNMLSKCPNIDNISAMFAGLKYLPACNLYMNMLSKQVKITNASYLFYSTYNLTGAVTASLAFNTLGNLLYAEKMFAFTNITSIAAGFLHGESKNTKLRRVSNIFYGCSNLTGTSPEFWNGDTFSAIQYDTNGYYGALYNCTRLTNYSTAQTNSANWVASTGLTGMW